MEKKQPNRAALATKRILDSIYDLIGQSPNAAGGNKRINADELGSLLDDLWATLPADIRYAQSVIDDAAKIEEAANNYARSREEEAKSRSESMVKRAQTQADKILEDANREYERRVSEHSVYTEAVSKAQAIGEQMQEKQRILINKLNVYISGRLNELRNCLITDLDDVEENIRLLSGTPTDNGDNTRKRRRTSAVSSDYEDERYDESADEYDDEVADDEQIQREPRSNGFSGWFGKITNLFSAQTSGLEDFEGDDEDSYDDDSDDENDDNG